MKQKIQSYIALTIIGMLLIFLSGCQTLKVLDENMSECFKDIQKCSGVKNKNESSTSGKQPQSKTPVGKKAPASIYYNYPKALVEKVQSTLNMKGYHAGNVDGAYGAGTREAVMNFQRDNNIAVTGKLDDVTVNKLGLDQILLTKEKTKAEKKSPQKTQQEASTDEVVISAPTTPSKTSTEETESINENKNDNSKATVYALTKTSATLVKAEANAFSSTIKELAKGIQVTIILSQGEWSKVMTDDIEGFIYSDDLQF